MSLSSTQIREGLGHPNNVEGARFENAVSAALAEDS